MIATRRNVIVFATVSAAVLVGAMAVPAPIEEGGAIDAASGLARATPATAMRAARETGDARRALDVLLGMPTAVRTDSTVRHWIGVLQNELDAAAIPPIDADPFGVLEREGISFERALVALRELSLDTTGVAIEELFAETEGAEGPDGRIADLVRAASAPEASPLDVVEALSVYEALTASARTRARLRWLLRVFESQPESTQVAQTLIGFYLAQGRLVEAHAVAKQHAAHDPESTDFWLQHAQIARWTNRPEVEAAALEQVVARVGDRTSRRRLLDLYTVLGLPERGLVHARSLAEQAVTVAELESTVEAALTRGDWDQALPMLERLATLSADPAKWREQIVDLSLRDLQVDRAIQELETLVHLDPEGGHVAALESLYRRSAQVEPLIDLVEWRLHRAPEEAWRRAELVQLHVAVGRRRRAAAIANNQAVLEPDRFEVRIDATERERLSAMRRIALDLASDVESGDRTIAEVIDSLRPFLDRPGFREFAESILERFPHDPQTRALRIELVDIGRSPFEMVAAAERLATDFPTDVEIVRLWVERAAWAEMAEFERAARERLREVAPADSRNRELLAQLYMDANEIDAAMTELEYLVAEHGLRSSATTLLIDCLFAAGDYQAATLWLVKLADDPSASTEDRLAAAEQLYFRRSYDSARVLYDRVLDVELDQPTALWRIGQILVWTNEPAAAIPFLVRRLEVSDLERGQVGYELGQALWTVGEDGRARAAHADALEVLDGLPEPTVSDRTKAAAIVARLGRMEEAALRFRDLVEDTPRNVDLVLDYADTLLAAGILGECGRMVAHARAVEPTHPRIPRLAAQVAMRNADYRTAETELELSLERDGPDASTYADLTHVRETLDEPVGALDAARRWQALRPDSDAAARVAHRLSDATSDFGVGQFRYRDIGSDEVIEASVAGAFWLDDDRRLDVELGRARYSGRAAAVGAGAVDLETDVTRLRAAFEQRLEGGHLLRGGLSFAATDAGDPLGGFAALHLHEDDPYRALELRLFANDLFAEPAAAAALGGRQHGFEASGYSELGDDWWTSGAARLRRLEIDAPGAGTVGDVHLGAEVSVGRRLLGGETAVGDRYRIDHAPSGPASPWLGDEPAADAAWSVNGWVSAQTYRLVGGDELDDLIPLGKSSDYLVAAARFDRQWARGFGTSLEAYAGLELSGSGVWGVDGALTWRPAHQAELSLRAGRGEALARDGGGDASHHLFLQLVWRW